MGVMTVDEVAEMWAARERIGGLMLVLRAQASSQELAVAEAVVEAADTAWTAWEAVLHLEAMSRHVRARQPAR